jgi:hypothetical protein
VTFYVFRNEFPRSTGGETCCFIFIVVLVAGFVDRAL